MADNIKIDLLINAAQSAKTIGETKKALKDLKSEALNLKEGSAAFTRLATAAGELQDKVADLGATTKYLGDDLKNIKGITGIGEGIAGGFAMASGAAALFGGENKKLEESMVKLQAIMAVIQGMQAIGDVLQKQSAATLFIKNMMTKAAIALGYEEVAVKEAAVVVTGEEVAATVADTAAKGAKIVATEAEILATESATLGQKALNLAMKANPIGILIALIVAGVSALMLWSNATSKSAEEEKKANEEKKKAAKILAEQNEQKKKAAEYVAEEGTGYAQMAEQLKKTNPGSAERLRLIKEINKSYGTTLKNLKDESAFQDQVTLSTEKYMEFLKTKQRLQALGDLQQKNTLKQNEIEDKLLVQRAELERSIQVRKSLGYKDTGRDLRIALAYQYEIIAATERELKAAKERFSKYGDYSDDLTNKLSKNGLKLKDEIVKVDKEITKSAQEAIKAQEDLDAALMKARKDFLESKLELTKQEEEQLDAIKNKEIGIMEDGIDKQTALINKAADDDIKTNKDKIAAKIKAEEDSQKAVEEAAIAAGKKLTEDDIKNRQEGIEKIKSLKEGQVAYELATNTQRDIDLGNAFEKSEIARHQKEDELNIAAIQSMKDAQLDALNERYANESIRGKDYLDAVDAINKEEEALLKAHGAYMIDIEHDTRGAREYVQDLGWATREVIFTKEAMAEKKVLDDKHAASLISEEQYQIDLRALEDKYAVVDEGKSISFKDTSIEYDDTKTRLENIMLLYKKHYAKTTEIQTDANVKSAEDQDAADKQKIADKEKFWEQMLALEKQGQELMMSIFNNAMAQRIYTINQEYDDKIQRIDDEMLAYENLQSERTIQEQQKYDIEQGFAERKKAAQIARDIEIDKVKQKQFNAQKANDIATIVIDTAIAVAKAVKASPLTFGLPWSAILAGMGAAQVATVASQKYIPSFATGGIFSGDGMVRGAGTGTSDSINAKLSNGESVINAKSTSLFGPVLSAINQAGGGVAIPHLKSGGIYREPAQNQSSLDTGAIIDAIYSAGNRPIEIETYVRESSITTAQKSKQRIKNRTSF